jgi:glycosyltransferase involved in cell wall biosynthesis
MNHPSQIRDPEVSVLMSCYNGGRWLREAIDSVIAQTFDDFELILVDDGSSDETWSIIESYRDRDRRIVAVSKSHTGLADSLNVGIAKARGAWIARLDQDDLCEPTRLEEQVNFVSNHPDVVLLGTGCLEIDNQGRAIKRHEYPSDHHDLVRRLERLRAFFPHSSAFYRADDVRKAGGYVSRIHRSEDSRLWLELTSRGNIACLPKLLVRIRRHSSQMSLDDDGHRQLCDGTTAIVCHFLRNAGHKDPSVEAREDEWIAFLEWIENRIEDSGIFERRKSWIGARTEYFTAQNRLNGTLRFGLRLLQSGNAGLQMWERLFGYSLPRRLAREWMKQA